MTSIIQTPEVTVVSGNLHNNTYNLYSEILQTPLLMEAILDQHARNNLASPKGGFEMKERNG